MEPQGDSCDAGEGRDAKHSLHVDTQKTSIGSSSTLGDSVHTLIIGRESFHASKLSEGTSVAVSEEELDDKDDEAGNEEYDDDAFDDNAEKEAMNRITAGFAAPIRSVLFVVGLARFAKERARVKHIVSSEGILTGEDADGENEGAKEEGEEDLSQQGNLDFYTTIALQKRKELMKSKEIKEVVKAIWEIKDLADARGEEETLPKKPYVDMLIKFHYLVMPVEQVDPMKAKMNAEVDWSNDTKGGMQPFGCHGIYSSRQYSRLRTHGQILLT